METPHYDVTRLRDDQVEEADSDVVSFKLVERIEAPKPEVVLDAVEGSGPKRQEAAVRNIQPDTQAPAPRFVERDGAQSTRATPAAETKAALGFVAWFKSLINALFGVKPAAVETPAPTQNRNRQNNNRNNPNNRQRNNRNNQRNDRNDRNDRPGKEPELVTTGGRTAIDKPAQERNRRPADATATDETTGQPRQRPPRPPRQPRQPRAAVAEENKVAAAVDATEAAVGDVEVNPAADADNTQAPRRRRNRHPSRRQRGPRERDPQVLIDAGLPVPAEMAGTAAATAAVVAVAETSETSAVASSSEAPAVEAATEAVKTEVVAEPVVTELMADEPAPKETVAETPAAVEAPVVAEAPVVEAAAAEAPAAEAEVVTEAVAVEVATTEQQPAVEVEATEVTVETTALETAPETAPEAKVRSNT